MPNYVRRMRWKGHGFLQRYQCRVEFPSRAISLLPEEKMPSFARRMPWKRLAPPTPSITRRFLLDLLLPV